MKVLFNPKSERGTDTMLTKKAFNETFREIWAMKEDLPDVMSVALLEIKDEMDDLASSEDFTDLALWVDEVLQEEGFLPVFFP